MLLTSADLAMLTLTFFDGFSPFFIDPDIRLSDIVLGVLTVVVEAASFLCLLGSLENCLSFESIPMLKSGVVSSLMFHCYLVIRYSTERDTVPIPYNMVAGWRNVS